MKITHAQLYDAIQENRPQREIEGMGGEWKKIHSNTNVWIDVCLDCSKDSERERDKKGEKQLIVNLKQMREEGELIHVCARTRENIIF